ncbi:class I glutamine amidotransferase-like protein [Coprinopsis marcescibilis]|uniref:Class I glutamine amidotransferase-like protein n=1 Tax=Coprinopsis marcescibilis TaxID=230819 RepID=A0A5C3L323_COPMA|nr:class I glutamine amidotransferase-like protein [Coprinopsis marcescibilis]
MAWTWALFLLFLAFKTVAQQSQPRILIYSATAAFRHDSIPSAIEVLQSQAQLINVLFDQTEDRMRFTDQSLGQYDAIIFLSNTGEVLDNSGKTALHNYLNSGGNFVGIHSSSDSLINTTFFIRELGAKFDYHADLQEATLNVIGPQHPSTTGVPQNWRIRDEMYNFESDPRAVGAEVVLSVDESSYVDRGPRRFDHGDPHPIAWFQERGAGVEEGGVAGRSFYTSLGHLTETWQDPIFLSHVLGGISWALQSNTTRAFNSNALVGNGEPGESTPVATPSPSETASSSETSIGGTSSTTSAQPGVSSTSPGHGVFVDSTASFVLMALVVVMT